MSTPLAEQQQALNARALAAQQRLSLAAPRLALAEEVLSRARHDDQLAGWEVAQAQKLLRLIRKIVAIRERDYQEAQADLEAAQAEIDRLRGEYREAGLPYPALRKDEGGTWHLPEGPE
jgi:hypothetical protein